MSTDYFRRLFKKNSLEQLELHISLSNKWGKLYYPVKNFFFPWNVVKLKKLDRSWCDVDGRMEHAIMQLLVDFFRGEQPFHVASGTPYEKNPTLQRCGELLPAAYGDDLENLELWTKLLDIAKWYEAGMSDIDGIDVYLAAHEADQTWEECLRLKEEYDTQRNEKFLFVVKHRARLWT